MKDIFFRKDERYLIKSDEISINYTE